MHRKIIVDAGSNPDYSTHMQIKVTNIQWDTDGDLETLAELPQTVLIPFGELAFDVDEDPDSEIADYLSDEHGFCVHGFDFELL